MSSSEAGSGTAIVVIFTLVGMMPKPAVPSGFVNCPSTPCWKFDISRSASGSYAAANAVLLGLGATPVSHANPATSTNPVKAPPHCPSGNRFRPLKPALAAPGKLCPPTEAEKLLMAI